jgi:hypothetical protein
MSNYSIFVYRVGALGTLAFVGAALMAYAELQLRRHRRHARKRV